MSSDPLQALVTATALCNLHTYLLLLPRDDEGAAEEARPGALLRADDPPAGHAVADQFVLSRLALACVPAGSLFNEC